MYSRAMGVMICSLFVGCGLQPAGSGEDLDSAQWASSGTTRLLKGIPVSGLSGALGEELHFLLPVPDGAEGLRFTLSGGNGNADLYVKYGSQPSLADYDCRSNRLNNNEACDAGADAGNWYVMVRGAKSFSGATLVGNYNDSPVAGFTHSTEVATVAFSNESFDSDGHIVSYVWDFGDGTTSMASDPNHTYAGSGAYDVTLTVVDNQGASDSVTQAVLATSDPDCTLYSGVLLGDDDYDYQPDGTYYVAPVGTHIGTLVGPPGTDFDLYLYRFSSGKWKLIDSSESDANVETVSYTGSSGYYLWKAKSYHGSGTYELSLCTP